MVVPRLDRGMSSARVDIHLNYSPFTVPISTIPLAGKTGCGIWGPHWVGTQDSKFISKLDDPDQIKYVKSFEGEWDSNWGLLTLKVEGIRVTGTYPYDNGRIEAKLSSDGLTIEGQWLEAPSYTPPDDGGRVIITISKDGQTSSGHWWYGQDQKGGDWTGRRMK